MYSAGDSSSDGLSGLNQFASMSGPIDWAAMAQQWIQMHDTGNLMPDAPPPPNISNSFHDTNTANKNVATRPVTTTAKKSFDEKGEADMEMDDEENARRGDTPPPPAPSMQLGKNREQAIMQSQAPWYMQHQSQVAGSPIDGNFIGADIGNNSKITPAAPQWNATVWPPRMNLPPPIAGSILNSAINDSVTNPTAHIPSLLKINVPNPNTVKMMTPNVEEQNNTAAAVDAKKRKMLPAWIREGLEKMEREKLRQLEREQSKRREEPSGSDSSNFTGSVGIAGDAMHTVNIKYKQSAENDMSGNEDEPEVEDFDGVAIGDETLVMPQKTAKGDEGSDNEHETDNENNTEQRTYMGKRSYEDRLSDLMIVVRTTLTELLLDVTNQEIANLAQEAVNAHKAKATSAQVIRKSALSSITGKLGLAAYDDSTGDESSDTDDETSADNDTNNDSEEEIKASIRAKRRAFAKVTDEIEERIAANAAREEQKLKYYCLLEKREEEDEELKDNAAGEAGQSDDAAIWSSSSSAMTSTVSKSYERDFGEATESKLQHSNGKRQRDRSSRKERTTRFSDNKDSKGAAAVAATYISNMHNANANPSGSVVFPIGTTAATSLVPVAGTTISASSSISAMPHESPHIAYNIANAAFIEDGDGVSMLNKNLLNAAEAAYEKATKGRRASSSRSSVSRSERERSHRSSRYDHRDSESDRYRDRERERERKRKSYHEHERERERERERDREKERYGDTKRRKHKARHSSDEDDDAAVDDNKNISQSSSGDTDTSSTTSTSTSSTSHHSSHYSRTSATVESKHRREHEYERSERRGERSDRSHRNDRSRSQSRGRHRSHHSSHRHSSLEDDYDNDSRLRHSSSRHSSSRKRSRSRSRSTYSSSSHWRRR
ncbi:PREDICTED: arginine/serine-rich protein PNISR [Rhagoletis zephyria]|uniref:arginine/serine-rich protein PNISR n=1 Tax=Rhagoletis zephyria TaxID=28612 RepID=UPI00081129AD|nr:PREDICTED: arginine/serine-rich protein PNISR [Rhagoletis zephyria]